MTLARKTALEALNIYKDLFKKRENDYRRELSAEKNERNIKYLEKKIEEYAEAHIEYNQIIQDMEKLSV